MINVLKPAAPMVVLALSSAALAGCDGNDISINGKQAVPLSEIEIAGPPPSELVLSSGDTVILTDGDTFAIKVEGQDTDSLRFVRDAEVIGITRTDGWSGKQTATIRITMPPPSEVVIAGSGIVQAQSLASTASVLIGGSGLVTFASVAAEKLDVNIGGSGKVTGAGIAKRLEINIGGSGDVELAGLKADSAEVSIGGAGDVAFASDGTVKAKIFGTGDVKVSGSAKCTAETFGSGTLTCAQGGNGATAAIPAPVETPETPGVPIAPKVPTAPAAAKPAQ